LTSNDRPACPGMKAPPEVVEPGALEIRCVDGPPEAARGTARCLRGLSPSSSCRARPAPRYGGGH